MGPSVFAAVGLASTVLCFSSSEGGVSAFSTPILSDVAVGARLHASAVRRGRGAARDERHDILLTQKIISRHIETNMKEQDFVVKEFHVEDDDDHHGGEWSEQLMGLKALVQGETYEPALTLARDTGSKIASAETYRPILESCKPVIDGVKSAGVLDSVKSAGSRIGEACRPVVDGVVSASGTIASGETYRPAFDKVKSAGSKVGDVCMSASGKIVSGETYRPAFDKIKSAGGKIKSAGCKVGDACMSAGGKIVSGETYRPAFDKVKSAGCKVGDACKSAGSALTTAETYKPAIDGVKSLAHGETYKPVIDGVKSLAHKETYKPAINGVKSLAHKKTYKHLSMRMRDVLRRNKDYGVSGDGAVVVAATNALNLGKLSVGTRPYVPGE